MPKAGTHLLTRLLELLHFREVGGSLDIGPNEGMEAIVRKYIQQASDSLSQIRPGCFSRSHMYFYQEILRIINENQLKTITIVRDPRDVCVSDAFHILKRSDHRLHPYYSKMSEDERLMASIVGMSSSQLGGDPPSSDIGFHYRHYLGWVKDGAGLVVKFEDLVGERGGGTDQAQMETVTKISKYLGLGLSRQKLIALCGNLFWTKARTFRKGQIGTWRQHFRPAHMKAFRDVVGTVMEDFGYGEE
jgi:hypothetical protein